MARGSGLTSGPGLPEPLLLDAAHIMADKDELYGQPVVPNGVPLSKIHHAAPARCLRTATATHAARPGCAVPTCPCSSPPSHPLPSPMNTGGIVRISWTAGRAPTGYRLHCTRPLHTESTSPGVAKSLTRSGGSTPFVCYSRWQSHFPEGLPMRLTVLLSSLLAVTSSGYAAEPTRDPAMGDKNLITEARRLKDRDAERLNKALEATKEKPAKPRTEKPAKARAEKPAKSGGTSAR
jgi:hypothetical protein